MWKPDLHPRDEYGRFKLRGEIGRWDSLLGAEGNRAHLRNIAEYDANQARQHVLDDKLHAGTLTDAEDAEWDRLGERATHLARNVIPKAHWMGAKPLENGMWQIPKGQRNGGLVVTAEGQRVTHMMAQGAIRVGNHPNPNSQASDRNAFMGSGVWHRPGEYGPGRVPILRNDYGYRMSQLEPEPTISRRHRDRRGASIRAEMKAEHRAYAPGEGGFKEFRRRGKEVRMASPEVHGAYQNDPRNPVSRMRTARKKRQRVSTTTWIQRLNAQMEGR